ncbi:hypothetical protein KVP09_13910 [Alcaligenaceae bacterium CGII-47]|nr:hypothetical protein [Alcaligenaceae bacterium CGII-47]
MRDGLVRAAFEIVGIRLSEQAGQDLETELRQVQVLLADYDLAQVIHTVYGADAAGRYVDLRLDQAFGDVWMPDHDTSGLAHRLDLDTHARAKDLEREILITMLGGPLPFVFPCAAELASAMHIRRNIVQAGRQTVLAFDTEGAERPEDYWTYTQASGFTVRPGQSIIAALKKATQPGSGRRYSFSCYRATEYVILLGLAQELARCHPALLAALQRQWESRAIMSGEFHDVFLHEYGSHDAPLPFQYYVPGDRLWFRNPDEPSASVEGYEGSWVMYLGEGLFTNFWKPDEPYTLRRKCIELYHWRHALREDARGHPYIDEDVVEARVQESLQDPVAANAILARMRRVRDPLGVYGDGGCIDATREYVRCVHAGLPGLVL